MKLYHASTVQVSSPDTVHSRNYLDFGRGFYLTSIKEQAIKDGERFIRRGKTAWLNTYEFSANMEEWEILQLEQYDKQWLDFVAACRKGYQVGDYDMVIGGIANDRVIETLDRYFAHKISQEEALQRLIYEKPNIQYCIRSERMLQECLTFKKSEQL